MSTFPVNPEKETQLAQRMAALGVRDADLEETFVRSGGHCCGTVPPGCW